MQVVFEGPVVRWIGTVNPGRGMARVEIDGVDYGLVDMYSPTWIQQQTVFTASGLGEGPHAMTITATEERNPSSSSRLIEIDAIEAEGVSSP